MNRTELETSLRKLRLSGMADSLEARCVEAKAGGLGGLDADDYCQGYHRDFICRSTGGGANNRKVCVPGGGTPCAVGDDCNADFPYCCEDAFGTNRCTDLAGAEGANCLNPPG